MLWYEQKLAIGRGKADNSENTTLGFRVWSDGRIVIFRRNKWQESMIKKNMKISTSLRKQSVTMMVT